MSEMLHIRVDEETKAQAAQAFEAMGLLAPKGMSTQQPDCYRIR